ncbi:hypothetical protein ABB37_02199 [Leptomonas pyrrhocoris]|uniref:Uncharacterized protein n=1 Tax=Leptomonas pyrrhocoris TaxID=157538 RepID=A0A0M9G7G6_LEPPY|nr:hypothetical protein ABB37_02199 [Leptomonas pyrrhocoris]KPA84103.1 hypothetical protein ABB37_02199 [Leptomonas pyrrhocoris]|eukprot:XP_015662542.1 hypothetical protein ABB37_02199 [Leptomonas pyrrhocoris]
MSSILPDTAPPDYNSAALRSGGGGGVLPHGGRAARAPMDRGVKRATECPCAVRLYHLAGNDVAARSEYCSVVLGAPSVGISEAVRTGVLPSSSSITPSTATAASTPADAQATAASQEDNKRVHAASALSSSPAVARPVAVQLAWGDTTVWEVAHTALRAVRADVDAAYDAERRQQAQKVKESIRERHPSNKAERPAEADNEEDEEEPAPYSTPLHRYVVELLTGSVNSLGQASIIPLCTVTCRLALPGHTGLLPVRRNSAVDYNTALYELAYNLGDPVFVTCTRAL